MKNRKNIAFGAAILVTALAFGAGASQWIEPGTSFAADRQQQAVVNAEAAAAIAQLQPSQTLLADLYDQVAPSVVNIQVTATRSQADSAIPEIPGLPFGLPEQG